MSKITELPGFLSNEPLANHTTFKIGGPAKYFFIAKTSEEVIKAVQAAAEENIPFYILGGGSNVLISDKGFEGLIVKVGSIKYEVQSSEVIVADSGVLLSRLVAEAAQNGLSGLEWAIGIPGTIGGAIRGNAGAYGHSIGESVENVKFLKLASTNSSVSSVKENDINYDTSQYWSICSMTKERCEFGYRASIFKKDKNLIVLEVVLKLAPGNKDEIQKKMTEIIKQRKNKIPPYPSGGSFFKNYELNEKEIHAFFDDRQKMREFLPQATDEELARWLEWKKIPAAWFIEQCGLRGKQVGEVKISDEHANFIINAGQAKAKDVIMLANLIKQQIKDKFGVQLQEEIEYVGF